VNDPLEILFLAGRIGLDDDGWPLSPLLDRLEQRGVLGRVICTASNGAAGEDPRFLEIPTLQNRWLRPLWIRGFRFDSELERPHLLHVIHEEMAEAAIALADSWQIPYLLTIDDFDTLSRGLRLSHRWFGRLIATSQELAESLVVQLGLPAARIVVIPPGMPLSREALESRTRAADSTPKAQLVKVVGTAGFPVPSSGMECFLDAAQRVVSQGHDAEFLVAAQGDDLIDLRRIASALGIADRVTVADFRDFGARFWGVLDLYCQPSLTPNSGRTLARAMAAGIACIASNVGGLQTLIEPGRTGLLVPAGDPAALAAAIVELLDNPLLAAALGGQAGIEVPTRFDLDREADLLTDLYRASLHPPVVTPLS
jgi:glycosyltransferase involved in cell wall biosynthesis